MGTQCPRCRSTETFGGKQGVNVGKAAVGFWALGPLGVLFGAQGRDDVVVSCTSCGHSWKAAHQSTRVSAGPKYGILGDDSNYAKAMCGSWLIWGTLTSLIVGLSLWWFVSGVAGGAWGFLSFFVPGGFPIAMLMYNPSKERFYQMVVNLGAGLLIVAAAVLLYLAMFTKVLHHKDLLGN